MSPAEPAARWVYDPHRGGRPIPAAVRRQVEGRLRSYAERRFAGLYRDLDVRFRGQFCYVDLYLDPGPLPEEWPPPAWSESREEALARLRATPLHLCRLRHLGGGDRFSFAFYSYASERYEPSALATGDLVGSPEDALEVCAGLRLE